jgi:hypothetical protein
MNYAAVDRVGKTFAFHKSERLERVDSRPSLIGQNRTTASGY